MAEELKELKKMLRSNLKILAKAILEDKVRWIEVYEEASQIVTALKDLDYKKKKSIDSWAVPEEFFCPFSDRIMEDPVILATGETYDRSFIQEWLNSGNQTCPLTQLGLANDRLTPNHFAKKIISKWCSERRTTLAAVNMKSKCAIIFDQESNLLNSLCDNLSSSSLLERKLAVKGLRILLKYKDSLRDILRQKPEIIPNLLALLSDPGFADDDRDDIQENAVTALLNLSMHNNNRKFIGDDPEALSRLIDMLSTGTLRAQCNAAAALYQLSFLDSNRIKIGELGALGPLTVNLKHCDMQLKLDSISAIWRLCLEPKNSEREVNECAVTILMEMINKQVLVEWALATLALLAKHKNAAEEIVQINGVTRLLGIIRESNISKENKENAVSILFSIFVDQEMNLKELREEESLNATITELANGGTLRAQRKAKGILQRLSRTANISYDTIYFSFTS